jgi:hypothetical protein
MARASVWDFDLQALRREPRIAHYFRYPLHRADFHELRQRGRLLGRFAAKPLYGRLTKQGGVDRSAGHNGQVALIFIPARARSAHAAQLMLTRMPRAEVTTTGGRRNWPAIRAAAERALRKQLHGPKLMRLLG